MHFLIVSGHRYAFLGPGGHFLDHATNPCSLIKLEIKLTQMTSKGNYLASIYQREEAMPLLAYTAKKDYNRELLIYSKKILIPTFKGLQLLQ